MQVFNIFLCLLFLSGQLKTMELGSALKEELSAPKVRILLGSQHKHIEHLKTELNLLEQQYKDSVEIIDQKIQDLGQQIVALQESLNAKNIAFVQKKMHLLKRLQQTFIQIKEIKEKTLELLNMHIEFWEKYFSQAMHQSNIIEEKSLYSFFDFQNMTTKLFVQQEQIQQLLIQKEAQNIVISREEHVLSSKEKELVFVQERIHDKRKQSDLNKDEIVILDLEKEIVLKEQELASLQLNFYQKQLNFFNSKELILQERAGLLQEQAKLIRSRLYIDIADVQQYEQKYAQQRSICEVKKAELAKFRHEIASAKLKEQEELDRLRARFKAIKVQTLKQIEEIEYQMHSSSENFASFSLAHAYASVVTYDRKLTNIKIDILVQEAKEKQAQITQDTVKLLYEISQGYVKDSQTFEKERVAYKQLKQSLINDIKNFKDEIIVISNNVKELQRILSHVLVQQEKAKNSEPSGSGSAHKKWSETIVLMEQLIKQLEQQHEILLSSSDLYEKIIKSQEETLESVDAILHEFNLIGVWHRSMSAVTWDGVKNVIPNLILFAKSLSVIVFGYLSEIKVQKIAYTLSSYGVGGILSLFFLLFCIFFGYLLLQAFLPTVQKNLLTNTSDETDPLYKPRQVLAIGIGFLISVFKPLYFWLVCLGYELLSEAPVALLIIFYISSVIFWIYASRKLLTQFILINRKFDYSLLSKRLIERFSHVFSFFSTATIIILVLRKMFMVVMVHQQTELPNILLRVYHIVIFISIIFSLDKEEIIQMLPKKSVLGQKFAQLFDHYYYLFLIAVFSLLILSDPYLGGYGTLMWHVCWNLCLSAGVLSGLFILHVLLKRYTTFLFFTHDASAVSGVTERFDYAKTWYAIYVIGLMLFFAGIAVVLCAYVWGYGFTYHTLRKIVMYELVKFETVNSLGKATPESFRILNLIYIITMTCIGIVSAYAFKKVVLQRVFDIQYVDPGIQNTITTISRYVIIIMAVMIACIQSKLGFVVTYVSFVGLATFGWSFKDLFTDFVAYFFILVQRPLKLGDYVRINDDTMGVVRRISPRAVILRRKNAVNIVVPNSTILKSSLYNWNYARTYIGFDDIIFCVPFGTNIELVREICFQVLEQDNDVLKIPQPFVRLQDFNERGYVFMVRGFLSSGNTLRQWDIASNIRFVLVAQLAKAGITIAAPMMKVTMNKEKTTDQLF
jgi:small-conductance mechanosensitive channel